MPSQFERIARNVVRRTTAHAHLLRERIDLARALLRSDRRQKRVVVVGAGLAGLACAERLVRLGHRVVVLEARDEPGGRSRTVRQPLASGLHADAGGGRFHDYDARIWRYVRRFGLHTQPFYPTGGRMVALIGGVRRIRSRGEALHDWCPRELSREERWIFAQETEAHYSKVSAGMDRVSVAMAQHLGGRVSYGSETIRIEHSADAVKVTSLVRGKPQSVEADHVVCAVPFVALRHIEIDPSFSSWKRQIVEGLPYESAMQIFLQYGSRPWEKEGLNGFAVTDTIGEIWHATHAHEGPRAILVTYAKGDLARHLMPLGYDERVAAAVDVVDTVFPGTRPHLETAVVTCWDEEKWAGGAQAKPDDMSSATISALRAPEGRVHFAGEHVGEHARGWMEGAIESGYYAADEVDRS